MYRPKSEAVEIKTDEVDVQSSIIYEYPEFAEICCFINHLGEKLGVLYTFPRIARLLSCKTDADLQSLTTLLVKLLNKMRLRTQLNRWQPALGRFLQRHAYNCDELRSIGDALNNGSLPTLFFSLPPQRRLCVLLFCLETQFHLNVPFKEKLKALDPQSLRTPPLGVDIFGNAYWFFIDTEFNFLLYRSAAEDMKLELLSDSFLTLEAVVKDLQDEKYEKTPVSELYAAFRATARQELDPLAFPSPPLQNLSDAQPPEKLKVDDTHVPVKMEAVELPKVQHVVLNVKKEEEEDTNAEKCPTETIKLAVDVSEEAFNQDEDALQQADCQGNSIEKEALDEMPGLRRSGRKRKQVEFLTMETFSKGTKAASVTKSKKSTLVVGKSRKEKSCKEKSSKKRKKRRRGKTYRNGHNGNGGCLWTCSPENSESDNEEDDMWNDAGSNDPDNSGSSLPEAEKNSSHDWLEDLESDFDLNAEGGDDSAVVAGRNLQRQKAQILDEAPCQICTKSYRPEWLLLCDSCDLGFHAQCLRPALHLIPEGDWFCPRCLHTRLVAALAEQLTAIQVHRKKLDSAARMQERLNFVNISVTNILRDERARPSAEGSDTSSVESEESFHRIRRNLPQYRGGSDSTSDDDSFSEGNVEGIDEREEDKDEEEEEEEENAELPVRSTRHRNVHYNVNAAFQQLDEVLVEDEKYAQQRLERSKVKSHQDEYEEEEMENQDDGLCSGPAILGSSELNVKRKTKPCSSSSSSSSSSILEGRKQRKRRKRASSGSDEFRPDGSENDEDDDDENEYAEVLGGNTSTEGSLSSDQSWKVGPRQRRRRGQRTSKKSRRRGPGRPRKEGQRRRRIPHFEGLLSDDDVGGGSGGDDVPVRRSARNRVNYKELESSDDEEKEGKGGNQEKSSNNIAVEHFPPPRRANADSGSEYAPSEEAEIGEKDEENEDNDCTDSSSLVLKKPPIVSAEEHKHIVTTNLEAVSPELGEDHANDALQIDEDSSGLKDDVIFQSLMIDEPFSPSRETGDSAEIQPSSQPL